MINWPEHKYGLHLNHNEHKNYYESLEDFLSQGQYTTTNEEKQLMLDQDEIWTLQWYPDNPTGFYSVAASTFEKCLELAKDAK